MLHILWNICIFTITIGILITIHELGHFSAARLCGVTVQRFSIGFGYVLWKFRDKKNTEYVISAIPLGGYVKMLNKNDISTTQTHIKNQLFEDKNVWQRALIIISGPIFNIIFAFFIYLFISMVGIATYRPIIADTLPNSICDQNHIPHHVEINAINNVKTPDWESVRLKLIDILLNDKEKNIIINVTPIQSTPHSTKYFINLKNLKFDINTQDIITSLGIIPLPIYTIKPIISKLQKNSSAMQAGLRIGDEILSINDQLITTWEICEKTIKNNPNTTLTLSVKRQHKILTIQIKPDKKIINKKIEGFIGISPTYLPISQEYIVIQRWGFITAIQKSTEKILNLTHIISNILYKLIIGDIKLKSLGGPLSIAQSAKIAADHGLISYLMFLSLISVHLGIINLLPLPILDGGYLFLLIIEIFGGKKISQQIQKYTYHIGIILLILLMCISIFNDLSRL